MPGFLITFEGGEGSGKTTQAALLAQRLREAGRTVVETREPGGSPGASALRHIILSGRAKALGPGGEALLFAAARSDHLRSTIGPALARGEIVVCDRFIDSTRVYQADGDNDEAIRHLEAATLGGVYPDLTLILDVPASIGAKRATERRGDEAIDRFEGEDETRHERRRAAFAALAHAERERCVVVDGQRDAAEVARVIASIVEERLDDARFEAARRAIGNPDQA